MRLDEVCTYRDTYRDTYKDTHKDTYKDTYSRLDAVGRGELPLLMQVVAVEDALFYHHLHTYKDTY